MDSRDINAGCQFGDRSSSRWNFNRRETEDKNDMYVISVVEICGSTAVEYCNAKRLFSIPYISGFIKSVFFERDDIENFISQYIREPVEVNNDKPGKKRRASKARAFFENLLEHYRAQTNSEPGTPEQLINYCIKNLPQGYTGILQDDNKIRWMEADQQQSVQIRAFKDAFNSD